MSAYVCLIEARLHFGDVRDLKGKRKLVHSLKTQVRQRFGASVAEIDGHDKWQRATLLCAVVGNAGTEARGDEIERFIRSCCPDGCYFERELLSLNDLRG